MTSFPMIVARYGMLLFGLAIGLGSLDASLVVDTRVTLLQATTQFGYVGSVNVQTASLERTSLTEDLQTLLDGSDSGSGSVGDTSWVATYEFRHDQSIEYLPAGGFFASGSTTLFAFSGDQGIATIDATSGNRLELGFTVTAPATYEFSGAFTDFADIVLEQSAGGDQWTPIAEPNVGDFDYALELSPGQYRLSAVGGGYHDLSQGAGSTWSVQLTTVPEPNALALLSAFLVLGAIVWRWRKS